MTYRMLILEFNLAKCFPKIDTVALVRALPFLVKEREFDKLMQLRKKVSLKAGTFTIRLFSLVSKALGIESG